MKFVFQSYFFELTFSLGLFLSFLYYNIKLFEKKELSIYKINYSLD